MSLLALTRWILALAAVLSCGRVAVAAEPVPHPVIPMTNVATDPANYAWLSDGARKALADAIDQHKNGSLADFVFSATPGGDFWAYQMTAKASDFVSVEDLARQSLEICEYYANTSCSIVSVNGFDVRDAAGGMPSEPYFLGTQPTEFDPQRVPFASRVNWSLFHGYLAMTKAKAFVLTTNGDAWWAQADSVEKAVAAAFADCHKGNKDNFCILYAANNRVVFTAGGLN